MVWILFQKNPSGEWQAYFPKCLFFQATGLHCPGCGCQRAIHHLFNGRFLLALQYNAMVILALPWLTWEAVRASLLLLEFPLPRFMLKRWRLSGRQTMSIAVAVTAFWILRNIPYRPFEWLAPPAMAVKDTGPQVLQAGSRDHGERSPEVTPTAMLPAPHDLSATGPPYPSRSKENPRIM